MGRRVKAKKTVDVPKMGCDHCNDQFPEDTIHVTEEGDFCPGCYDVLFGSCAHCAKSCHQSNMEDSTDGLVCASCMDQHYNRCHRCFEYHQRDRMTSRNDYLYCQGCNGNIPQTIHEHAYTPTLNFQKMSWENTFYLGVELELNVASSPEEHAGELMKFLQTLGCADLFYLKYDGSVSNGYEIVTHPFTLQAAHDRIHWHKILEWLKKNGATSYESGQCGLHVHVSKQGMNRLDVGKLKLFMAQNQGPMTEFSKRKKFEYCEFGCFDRNTLFDYLRGTYRQSGRYHALNIDTGKGTLEFRVFRGTLNYKRFMASIQFCEAISYYVKECSVQSILGGGSWKAFNEWLLKANRYQLLRQYLIAKKLQDWKPEVDKKNKTAKTVHRSADGILYMATPTTEPRSWWLGSRVSILDATLDS